ncbi:MAG: hypothetical protein IJV32_02485 [Bacteroidales bacterium]|nr:hypothetical protein [Bacteroidales bacterium]
MNKNIIRILAVSLAACGAFTACVTPENPYEGETVPNLTVTAVSPSFTADKAELELTLSQFVHKDLAVEFDVSGVDRGALDLPDSYLFPAGTVKQKITINAYSAELEPKDYQITITPSSSEAKVVSSPVSLALSVKDEAFVNLSMTPLDEDQKSIITVSLSRKLSESVTLPIKVDGTPSDGVTLLPESAITYEKSVTIPAGETSARTEVALDLWSVEPGQYEFVYEIGSFTSKAKAGTTTVLRLLVRAGIELNRHKWHDGDYWDYYETDGQVYTYGGLGSGITRLAVFCLKKTEMPDMTDNAAVIEFISQLGEGLTESNTYAAPATTSDYIWFPKSVAPDKRAKTYYFVMIGVNDKLRPTGDYDYFEYIYEDGLDLVKTSWRFIYYYDWYYVYQTGVKFSFTTVPGDYDMTDELVVIKLIKQFESELKAAGTPTFNTGSSTADYACFELSAASYTTAPNYTWNGENSSTDSYHGIMVGLEADGTATGEYNYLTFNWE